MNGQGGRNKTAGDKLHSGETMINLLIARKEKGFERGKCYRVGRLTFLLTNVTEFFNKTNRNLILLSYFF